MHHHLAPWRGGQAVLAALTAGWLIAGAAGALGSAPAGPGARASDLAMTSTYLPASMSLPASPVPASPILLDAGGPAGAGWAADTAASPSTYLATGQSNKVSSTTRTVKATDWTIPVGTPPSVFQTERWSLGSSLNFVVPVPAGTSVVRLFFAENYPPAQAVGARLMNIVINGSTVDRDLDVFKLVGAYAGLARTYHVTTAGSIAVSITNPRHTNSPHLMGLEITPPAAPPPPVTTTVPSPQEITLSPGADVAAAVAAAPANTSFVLQNGTYDVGGIVARSGDVISGQSRDGVILDGGRARPDAFTGTASDVTISHLTVRHYAPARLFGAIDGTHSVRWTMTDLRVTDNAEEGIAVGPGSVVDEVLADGNGNVGIGTGNVNNDPYGTPFADLIFSVENSELAYNGAQDPVDAAGAKVLFTNGATFTNDYVHNNYGFGLWTDAYNLNTVYQNNTVTNNTAGGIFHEISGSAVIRNNVISDNAIGYCNGMSYFCGTGGISISDSHDVAVYDNTLTGNHDEIVGYNGHGSGSLLYDLQVHNNVMTDTVGTTGMQTWPYDAGAYATSAWHDNTYRTGQLFWWRGEYMDMSSWNAANQS